MGVGRIDALSQERLRLYVRWRTVAGMALLFKNVPVRMDRLSSDLRLIGSMRWRGHPGMPATFESLEIPNVNPYAT